LSEIRLKNYLSGILGEGLDFEATLSYGRTVNGKRKIVINSKGRLIQQAFLWKANDNLTAEYISERLA